MWKLLRNLLLAGVLLAGALKLLAWYEAGQDAQRLSAMLAPAAELRYDGVSAGLDGSVGLNNVVLTVKGPHGGAYRADRFVVETPNVFWLLKHALLSGDDWPSHFGLGVQGLKLPASLHFDPHWLDPATLVPFETAGCVAAAFSAADFRRMDVAIADLALQQHGDFRYDTEAKELDGSLTLTAADTASVTFSVDVHQFDGAALRSLDGLRKLRVDRLGVDYADNNGFLRRRNQFCAQRGNVGAGQWVEQHLAAVQAQLQEHGVEATPEVLKLYRRLVETGGRASVLSLPNAGFTARALFETPPEELLRQLNVTARYADSPPMMLRLNFPVPPAEAETAVAEGATPPGPATSGTTPAPVPAPGTAPAAAAPVAGSTAAPPVVATPPAPNVATTSTTAAAKPSPTPTPTPARAPSPVPSRLPTPGPPTASAPTAAATAPPATTTAAAPPATAPKPAAVLARPATSGNGLEEFDRAAARLAPPPPAQPAAPARRESATAASTSSGVLPSSTPPPAESGSALALAWKPTFERLPAAGPERHDFDTIEFAALRGETGRYVRLTTQGGKRVEGYVVSADDNEVELRVSEGGGSARFVVQKAHVQQVQVAHAGSPPA